MKIKRVIQYLMVNDACWFVLKPFVYVSTRLQLSRQNFMLRKQEDANEVLCRGIFKTATVLNGLFQGMRMGDIRATGSSVYAKLLGSYELEIMPDLKNLLNQKYQFLINVGSDEGYYAVGIARLQPGIKVYAFDCNKEAQASCRALAVLNNADQQIITKGCFALEEMPAVASGEKALFIIDCEGCEGEMMTDELIRSFGSADFVIELHFEKNPLIADKLQALFAPTHNIRLVKALSDHERIMQYDFAEISKLNYDQKKYILNERNCFMQWLIATSKIRG